MKQGRVTASAAIRTSLEALEVVRFGSFDLFERARKAKADNTQFKLTVDQNRLAKGVIKKLSCRSTNNRK